MISPNAFVHPNAKLGKDVIVDAFAYIDDNVEIGDGTHVFPNATILSGARIGKNCRMEHCTTNRSQSRPQQSMPQSLR